MYCKRKGTEGPVFLWTAVKEKNKEMVRCNADGSDLGSEAKAPAPAKPRNKKAEPAPAEQPVVAAETPAAVE